MKIKFYAVFIVSLVLIVFAGIVLAGCGNVSGGGSTSYLVGHDKQGHPIYREAD
jgi:outer membrane PBP1 activator LpoA protein